MTTGLLAFQLLLGALTIWTGKAVIPTTFHVLVGALLLAAHLRLFLLARRFLAVGKPLRYGGVAPVGATPSALMATTFFVFGL